MYLPSVCMFPRTLQTRARSPKPPAKIKTHAHISFHWIKKMRCGGYEYDLKKLFDHEFLVGLTD